MRNSVVLICLLILIAISAGCSDSQQSNNKNLDKELTQTQINEIIAATNESLIKDIDYSEISEPEPDPEKQAELNEKFRQLGEKLKGKVTIENSHIIVARANGEAITLSDWYYEKSWKSGKAENNKEPLPSDKEIFNNLVRVKAISSAARELGLYPPEEQLNAYMADQEKQMEEVELEEFIVLLEAWGISEEEYLILMEERFADSLASANWTIYLEKYGDSPKEEQGYSVKSPLWIDDALNKKIMSLAEKAIVEITSEGNQLGITY